jgi:poly(3-hydroxybutyrate) depolymerase
MIFNNRLFSASTAFCLLCFCIAGPLFAVDQPADRVSPSADNPEKINDPNFAPGREARIDVNSKLVGIDHFMVYVPSDYNDKQDWPVIFFYHGMGGQPTTWPFKQITGGKGFIVIGMGYVPGSENPMTEGQYVNYIKRQRKSVLEVKRYISERLRIDEKRFFITGSSKGGWHASSMLESSPKAWAGAVILAAGRSRNARLIAADSGRMALRGKPIYIGAGERDINLAAAKKTAAYYEKLGAEVTFEEYKGAEHAFDPAKPKKLYNWLITNSSMEDTQSDKTD